MPAATFPVGPRPEAITVADFNGDGVRDIAVVNRGLPPTRESSLSVLLGKGDGSFLPAVTTDVLTGSNALAVADFNGDGVRDVALTSSVNHTVELLFGKGDGSFQESERLFRVGRGPVSVAAGDFDRDGTPDLVTANSGSHTVSVLLAPGRDPFRPRIDLPVGQGPAAVVVGDFNGDALQDLVTANTASNSVGVLLGLGDGSFAETQAFATGPSPQAVAVADFDADGTSDLAVLERAGSPSAVRVLAGNGDGTFRSMSRTETAFTLTQLAAGDFNDDGIADLAVIGPLAFPARVVVFTGNGDGTFRGPEFFNTGGTLPFGLAADDLDGDGRADLAIANTFSNDVGVLLNKAAPRQIGTLFTGVQEGVDLDVPFVLSTLGKKSPPPFDVDGQSIVNTDHGPFTLGTGRFRATFGGDGRAFHSGIPELYQFAEGGRNFWGVRGPGLGIISFDDLPAAEVTVFARGTHDGLVSPPEQDLDGDGITDFRGFGQLGNARGFLVAFSPDGKQLAVLELDNMAMREFTITGPVSVLVLVNLGDANSFADIAGLTARPDTGGGSSPFGMAGGLGAGDLRHLAIANHLTRSVGPAPARRGESTVPSEQALSATLRTPAPPGATEASVPRRARPAPAAAVVEDVFTPETA